MQELAGTTHVIFPTAFVRVAAVFANHCEELVRFWFVRLPSKNLSSRSTPPCTDAAKDSATADVRARGSSLFIEPGGLMSFLAANEHKLYFEHHPKLDT